MRIGLHRVHVFLKDPSVALAYLGLLSSCSFQILLLCVSQCLLPLGLQSVEDLFGEVVVGELVLECLDGGVDNILVELLSALGDVVSLVLHFPIKNN
jgi:hypothetical protein